MRNQWSLWSLLLLVVSSPLLAEGGHLGEYFFGRRPSTQDLLFKDRVARENAQILQSKASLSFHQVGSKMGKATETYYNGISKQVIPDWFIFAAGKRISPGVRANPYCRIHLEIPSPTRPNPIAPADSNGSFRVANSVPFPDGSQQAGIRQSFSYRNQNRDYNNKLELLFPLPGGAVGIVWCWKTSPEVNPWTLGELRAVFGDRPGEPGAILRFQLGGS